MSGIVVLELNPAQVLDEAGSDGLGAWEKDAIQRKDQLRSDRTQRRLREMVEIRIGTGARG